MIGDDGGSRNFGESAWNPGIQSTFTRELLALSTIFRPQNIFNDLEQAIELRDTTGIELEQLAIFRPERLAVHAVLVHLAADYEIPDPESADVRSLGLNFRSMVQTVLTRALPPLATQLTEAYVHLKATLADYIEEQLSLCFTETWPSTVAQSASGLSRSFWQRLRSSASSDPSPSREPNWTRDQRVLHIWRGRAQSSRSPLHAAACRALLTVASAVYAKHGRMPRRAGFIGQLATDLACNDYGSELISRLVEPAIGAVAEKAIYRKLPTQAEPVLMITKGASASGKSTMRPFQRTLAAKMGLHWRDFALISPDVWRRVLLDFESLGSLYKYAGMLTSQEIAIIDGKLHRYLMQKGEQGRLSHLWVDRFRFADTEEVERLLIRFGKVLCYFFMITPPHETVERAWRRGLEVGRYKAVDDLLAHNVEAFTGMQNILFARALTPNPGLHYEFVDNDVPCGTPPLTVAFGWGGEMNVLDVPCMLDVSRHQKINIEARSADETYPDATTMSAERNVDFLVNCVRRFPELNFADRTSGRIYARFVGGCLRWTDPEALARVAADPETEAALRAVAPALFMTVDARRERRPEFLQKRHHLTFGQWGGVSPRL
jgi:hypothetical protein